MNGKSQLSSPRSNRWHRRLAPVFRRVIHTAFIKTVLAHDKTLVLSQALASCKSASSLGQHNGMVGWKNTFFFLALAHMFVTWCSLSQVLHVPCKSVLKV